MQNEKSRLREAISRIPLLRDYSLEVLSPLRLGGLTNHNYLVHPPEHGKLVLRLAGPGTDDYIDRKAERYNADVATRAGVNVKVYFFDETDGTMLARFVEAETMSIASLRDLERVKRAAVAFRELHTCGEPFEGRFDLFQQVNMYLGVLRKLESPLPDGFEELKSSASEVRMALEKWELPYVACHCDPLYENLLDDGERMWIIDFEYGGNSDPMWDLGDLSVEAEFNAEQDKALLEAYFDGPPTSFDQARMVMYKGLCDILWTLWGVVQHANGNPADDFWTYSVNRLERGKALMESDNFRRHLEIVKNGPRT